MKLLEKIEVFLNSFKNSGEKNESGFFKDSLTQLSLNINPEMQEDGSFLSPAYLPMAIDVEDIVPQEHNPNSHNSKSFEALQTSILNTGYTFPIIIAPNPYYNPELDMSKKPSFRNDKNTDRTTEVRDPEIRAYFKYTIVDGSHRFNAILQNDEIFKREQGKIPCVMLRNKTEAELMSSEILMNTAKGEHSLDGMKDIVARLIDSGMKEDWIARNLYLDKESIARYKTLSGLASAFNDSTKFSEDVWDPKKDRAEERKNNKKQYQLARAYVVAWRNLANEGLDKPKFDIPEALNILAAAKNLGWDPANPYVVPTSVDKETGEVLSTELKNIELSEDLEEVKE